MLRTKSYFRVATSEVLITAVWAGQQVDRSALGVCSIILYGENYLLNRDEYMHNCYSYHGLINIVM